jgi:FKBP-type peptidyl-prolyl cis-trans isomerase
MRKRGWGWLGAILGGAAMAGCDPGPIIPVTPPGAVIPKESPDPEPAQAVGEMAAPALNDAVVKTKTVEYTPALPTKIGEKKTTAHGIVYETLREGSGPELKMGQTFRAHYEGKLANGEVFDTTRKRKQPMVVSLSGTEQIKGWSECLPGMRVGEIRRMTVPPEMGYGKEGRPPEIPPNATLIFEVELIDIL